MDSTQGMINIPRDRLVVVLQGIIELTLEDQRSLLDTLRGRLASQASSFEGLGSLDIGLMKDVAIDAAEVMADKLIINDRSVPLQTTSIKDRLGEVMSSPEVTDFIASNDTDDARAIRDAISKAVESQASVGVQTPDEIARSYEVTWRRVDAYLSLEKELGSIDPSSQTTRDEFIRRSVTPEEWSTEAYKDLTAILDQFAAALEGFMDTFIDALVENQLGDGEQVSSVLAELVKGQVRTMLNAELEPFFTQLKQAARAFLDRRYMELWVEPDMA